MRTARSRPRPGRFRRASDIGAKSRRFPVSAHRARLIEFFFPPEFDAVVLSWLQTEKRTPPGDLPVPEEPSR